MTPFLYYIGRSSLYLALFYAFFLLVMRRTTFFRLNRALLLTGTLACFLLPFLRLRTVDATFAAAGPLVEMASDPALTDGPSATSPFPYLELLYLVGILTVLAWTVVAVFRMARTIRSGEVRRLEDGTRLVLTEADIPSFSWGRTIVMSRKDAAENRVILLHEQAHVRKAHTFDILLFTAVTLVHWFNPLVWITLTELKLLHEYEADDAVLDQGIDATQYQLLLVRKAVGDKRFTLANGFQHAKLKNRIDMMLKNPSSGWLRLSWLAILPFLAGTMFLCNPVRARVVSAAPEILPETVAALTDTTESVPFQLIDPECKPIFNGGDAGSFAKWVNENLVYPEAAKKAGVEGRVLVQFVVCPDGKVRDAKILRGANPDLDAEALRVVNSSPDWTPGTVNGEPVKVTYSFPIIFRLSEKKAEGQDGPVTDANGIRYDNEASRIFFRSKTPPEAVLVILDGKEGPKIGDIDPATISSIHVLNVEESVSKYGEKGRYGVIEITSKK